MRVCDVVCNSVWYDPRVRKQIVEYKNRGIEVSAIGLKCRRYDPEKIADLPCPTNIVCISEKYERSLKNPLLKIWREHLKNRGIRDALLEEKPDVVHANDLDALLAAYPVCKKLGCVLVYDSHEVFTENAGAASRYKFLLPMLKYLEAYMVRHLDLMVCVSHAAADYFAEIYGIRKPIVVTNCSLQRETAADTPKNEGFEVLNHGQFYGGRGYDIMVETATLLKAYPQIRLAMRGFGVMEQQLRDRVAELKADNVLFYPKVRVEELIPMAAGAMVGVAITEPTCLNFELSVSNKLFEYASAGLPVIMSDIPEHRYLNGQYQIGIILPENTPEALAEAVIRLYRDKDFYENCKQNAKNMTRNLNWETEFRKLIQLEQELVVKNHEKKHK